MDFLKKKGTLLHIVVDIACILFLATYTMKLNSKIKQLEQIVRQTKLHIGKQDQQIRYLSSLDKTREEYTFPDIPKAPTQGFVHINVEPNMPVEPPQHANVFDIEFLSMGDDDSPSTLEFVDSNEIDEKEEYQLDQEIDDELKKINIELKEN